MYSHYSYYQQIPVVILGKVCTILTSILLVLPLTVVCKKELIHVLVVLMMEWNGIFPQPHA